MASILFKFKLSIRTRHSFKTFFFGFGQICTPWSLPLGSEKVCPIYLLLINTKFKIRNQMDLKKYRMVFTWMKCPRYFTLGLVLHYHAIQLPWKNSWHFVILSEVKQYHVHVSRPASHHASRHVTLYVALDVRLHVRLHVSPHFTLNVTLHVSSLVFLGPLLLARVRENALLQILIHTLFLGFLFQLQWSYHKVCDSYYCFTTKVQRISKWRWQTTAC